MIVHLGCKLLELKLWVDWGACPLVEGDLLIIITMVVKVEMVTIVLGVYDPPWSALRMLKDPKSSVMMISSLRKTRPIVTTATAGGGVLLSSQCPF